MSAASRTVRVFISSTFRDMHAERDHLVTVVFPELRERFEKLGLEFYDVDLRWGVPAKDANGETANSWQYCRQWIDRVEPLFVCILGQRYGYRPEPGEFRDPAEQARQQTQRRSITELEVRHAFLNDRRKRRSYFYLRETLVPVPPPGATVDERTTYDKFVDPAEQLDQLDALKADIRGCDRPVRDYGCRWTGDGFTELDPTRNLRTCSRRSMRSFCLMPIDPRTTEARSTGSIKQRAILAHLALRPEIALTQPQWCAASLGRKRDATCYASYVLPPCSPCLRGKPFALCLRSEEDS
jgi:hypothetical protein